MLWQLLDQLLVLFAKALGYTALALVLSFWLLVALAIFANIYRLLT